MRRAVNFVILGCVLSGLMASPAAWRSDSAAGSLGSSAQASPALAFIAGTVKDDSGKPLAGALVAVFTGMSGSLSSQLPKSLKSITTDGEGKFQLGVAPGTYRLRAEADGYKPTFTLINVDGTDKLTRNFSLRRINTLVEKRGDRADYRWIARSAERNILHYQDDAEATETSEQAAGTQADETVKSDSFLPAHPSFHGILQLTAGASAASGDLPGVSFFGTNFAVSSAISENLEVALMGQSGFGYGAPQRLTAIAAMRPAERHQVTASVGYGQIPLHAFATNPRTPRSLDQLSLAATDSWQVFRPLLVIYGFNYSRFTGSNGRESLLPRIAVQYTPTSKTKLYAAVTPGADTARLSPEGLSSENIQARFESSPAEIATNITGAEKFDPVVDRSRRMEFGVERTFGGGAASVEAAAFYDLAAGHGLGVLALPLEATAETQQAMEQVAHQVVALRGSTRGLRLMYAQRLNDYLTASLGYSLGRGERFNPASLGTLSPAEMFTGGTFQVASAKLDLDLKQRTGTRVSTVVRLSPSAVVFAIDPFAGRMSVFDPNISIYVTQELPSFGLPVRWQAVVDIRNLLNQINGVDGEKAQLIAARAQRTVRGGIAIQW